MFLSRNLSYMRERGALRKPSRIFARSLKPQQLKSGRRARVNSKAAAKAPKVKLGIDEISSMLMENVEKKARMVAKKEAAAAAATALAAGIELTSEEAAATGAAAAAAAAMGVNMGPATDMLENGKRKVVKGRPSNPAIRSQLARANLQKRGEQAAFCDEHPAVHRIRYQRETVKHCHFHFCYGTDGMLRQTVDITESRCPWCRLKCMSLNGLLHHLASCHDRCNYQVKRDVLGSIDVTAMVIEPSKQPKDARKSKTDVTVVLEKYEEEDMELEDVLAEDLQVDEEEEDEPLKPKKVTKRALKEAALAAAATKVAKVTNAAAHTMPRQHHLTIAARSHCPC